MNTFLGGSHKTTKKMHIFSWQLNKLAQEMQTFLGNSMQLEAQRDSAGLGVFF
jgi:hypothetical protein